MQAHPFHASRACIHESLTVFADLPGSRRRCSIRSAPWVAASHFSTQTRLRELRISSGKSWHTGCAGVHDCVDRDSRNARASRSSCLSQAGRAHGISCGISWMHMRAVYTGMSMSVALVCLHVLVKTLFESYLSVTVSIGEIDFTSARHWVTPSRAPARRVPSRTRWALRALDGYCWPTGTCELSIRHLTSIIMNDQRNR